MKNDGFFVNKNNAIYRYEWDKGANDERYRLEKATYQPGALGLPPTDVPLAYHELDQNIILLTERAGGLTHFAAWLRKHGDTWKMFSLRNMSEKDRQVYEGFLAGDNGNYILDRTSFLDKANQFSEDAGGLAKIAHRLESEKWLESDNQFVCMSYEVENLQNDILFSSIFDRSHAYRLPQFNREEIEEWLEELLEKYGIEISEDARQAIAGFVRSSIGGQPKLTQLLFRLVDDRITDLNIALSKINLLDVFRSEASQIQKYPPNVVYRWKKELNSLLENNPERRSLLGKYAEGHVKPDSYDYSTDDMVFYLAGWVAQNNERKWGIRSECHRQWAIDVLRGDL